MADGAEGLIIEVESGANGAISSLELLATKLEMLKTTCKASGSLNTYAKNYKNLITTINGNVISQANMESLRYFENQLRKFEGLKFSPTIAKGFQNIDNVIKSMSAESLTNLGTFTNALANLSQMKGVSIYKSTVDNLTKLAELAKNLDASSVQNLNSFAEALAKLQVFTEVDTTSMKELASSMKTFSSATKGATQRGRTFNTVLANVRTRTMGVYIALSRITSLAGKTMSVYGDYVESLNLFKMAIGEAAGAEYEFAKRAQDLLGIDLTQWMQAQGVFNALASGFGVASDKAALMSRNLTQLAYDISSFYNITVEDAIQKVQSGFAGQIRPVRNLGYDLSQARLEAIALANGIDEEVKSMTQAEKSQLRYIALMTQLTEVQGDLARTLDSPTNQMRLLNAQLDQMQRSIGLVLLPLLNKIIPYLNAIFRVVKMIAEEIAAMFGYTLPALSGTDFTSNISMGADELEEDLEDANSAAKELKNTLASFDQINLITSSSKGNGGGTGGSTSTGGLNLDLPSYDFLGDVTENQAQKIADGMMRSLRPFVDFLKESIKWTVDHIDELKGLLELIAGVTILGKLATKAKEIFTWFKDLDSIVKGIGFITIGFQLSYVGGKNLAAAETIEDSVMAVLKIALGAVAGAIGGYYLLGGATGIVLGATVSLIWALKGYQDQKMEEMKQRIHDTFFEFEEGRQSVEDFNKQWEQFVDKYANPELKEKLDISKDFRDSVSNIGGSIDELRKNYMYSQLTTEQYVTAIGELFGEMEETIKEHTEASSEAIRTALSGELGIFLQRSGVSLTRVDELLTQADENIQKAIEDIREELDALNQQLLDGMDTEEYNAQFQELIDKLGQYYDVTSMTRNVAKDFADLFDTTGINFTSYEDFIQTVENVESTYGDMVTSLRENRDSLIADMKSKLPGLSAEEQAEWQKMIDLTAEYFNQQEAELTTGYQNVLNRIEGTAFENWDKVFNTDGFLTATSSLGSGMFDLMTAVDTAFSKHNLDRPVTAFSEAAQLAHDAQELVKGSTGNLWDIVAKFPKDKFEDAFYRISKGYDKSTQTYKKFGGETTRTTDAVMTSLANMVSAGQRDWDRYGYYVAINTNKASSILPEIPKSMQKNLLETTGLLDAHKNDFGIKSAMLMGQVSLAFADSKNTAKNNMKHTLDIASGELVTSDIQAKYKNNANTLLGSMVGSLSDPMGRVKKAISDTLNSNQPEMEKLGKNLGLGIAKGMDSVSGDAENSTSKLTKRMGKPFNQFGSDLYDYMNTMTAGIVAIWNSIEISTGKATLSSKLKIPKWAMKGYATGGFPTSADFFYANENGVPEYVGTMGGRTAVANNQEITKGVADAVYKAIKDTGIANDVKKIASKDGKVVFAPSEQAGKVMQQSVNMYNSTGGRY